MLHLVRAHLSFHRKVTFAEFRDVPSTTQPATFRSTVPPLQSSAENSGELRDQSITERLRTGVRGTIDCTLYLSPWVAPPKPACPTRFHWNPLYRTWLLYKAYPSQTALLDVTLLRKILKGGGQHPISKTLSSNIPSFVLLQHFTHMHPYKRA